MRIISVGRVAGIGADDDHLYGGTGYLLRFSIESAEQFFGMQLPFIVDTLKDALNIDVRNIMRLELLGDGSSGLRHVVLCISFEDSSSEAERPEDAIEKLCAAPSTPPRYSFGLQGDVLRERLINFFLLAPNAVKSRFVRDSARAMRHSDVKSAGMQYEADAAGFLYRISYHAGSPPCIKEWRNVLLYCADTLRRAFRPERLDRVAFTAIPNTDEDYRVEAEFLFAAKPRVYKARSELRFRPMKTHGSGLAFEPSPDLPEQKLPPPEKRAVDKFDELDTQERLNVWNRHLSKFYK
jgi:hypothetical protein